MKKSNNYNKLYSVTLPVSRISDDDKLKMYSVFEKYYEQISFEEFCSDLSKKNAVIILKDQKHSQIRGFSTLLILNLIENGKKIRGIFSGDTVIEKEFWGQTALGKAFLKYLFIEKIKYPFNPLYWFLISKGYKTYLMMSNNFKEHYPRYEQETPTHAKNILDAFASRLYPNYYQRETGLIEFPYVSAHLKSQVAPISDELKATNPRVAFFASQNPHWEQGTELACIARMTWMMPFEYGLKALKKTLPIFQSTPKKVRIRRSPISNLTTLQ